jgi:hypothetical protein
MTVRNADHAVRVQTRRREAGKKGRSKAVRRWVKREFGMGVDACPGIVGGVLRDALKGDFTRCRSFQETHLSQEDMV